MICLGSDDYIVGLDATTHLNMNHDIELALRFTTGIKNGDEFFTDLNGFQVFVWKDFEGPLSKYMYSFVFITIDNPSENI